MRLGVDSSPVPQHSFENPFLIFLNTLAKAWLDPMDFRTELTKADPGGPTPAIPSRVFRHEPSVYKMIAIEHIGLVPGLSPGPNTAVTCLEYDPHEASSMFLG